MNSGFREGAVESAALSFAVGRATGPDRRRSYASALAASIAAMSIFRIVIIAWKARFAAALSDCFSAAIRARGTICHEKPQRSLHQPQALSRPPPSTMAF